MDPNTQQPSNPAATNGIPQQPIVPSEPAQQGIPTPQPTIPPPPPVPEHGEGKSHKSVILGIIVLALLIVIGGAVYLFFMQQGTPTEVEPVQVQEPTPTTIVSPTEVPVEGTVEEVENIDIGSPEADLTDIQTDVEEL